MGVGSLPWRVGREVDDCREGNVGAQVAEELEFSEAMVLEVGGAAAAVVSLEGLGLELW